MIVTSLLVPWANLVPSHTRAACCLCAWSRHTQLWRVPLVQAAKTGAVDRDANLASTIPRLPSVAVPNKPPVISANVAKFTNGALVDTGKFGTRSQKPASRVYRIRVRS